MTSEQSISDDEQKLESEDFEMRLREFHKSRGSPVMRPPLIGQHPINLCHMYRLVLANGGMDRVTQEMKWRSLYLQLNLPPNNTSASYAIRQTYKK